MTSSSNHIKSSTELVVYQPKALADKQIANIAVARKTASVFRSSYKAQFADYSHFHRSWMGDIIVLIGNSTAGKTSIIQSLKQIQPARIEEGVDLKVTAAVLHFFRNSCPTEVAMLERVMDPLEIPRAVRCKELVWKTEVSDAEKNEIEAALERMKSRFGALTDEDNKTYFPDLELSMWDGVLERARQGESVIFDTFSPDGFVKHIGLRNFDGPFRVVLVYCPFHILSSRMEKRNKEAEESGQLSNQRIGAYPLTQFSDYFTQRKDGQKPFETITRDQAIKAFNDNFDQEIPFARNEGQTDAEIQLRKEKSRQTFLDQLGFKKHMDRVEIAPRDQHLYDLILNTGKLKPEESAKILSKAY